MAAEKNPIAFDLGRALVVATEHGRTFAADRDVGYRAALYLLRGRQPTDDELSAAFGWTSSNAAKLIAEDVIARGATADDAALVAAAYLEAIEAGLSGASA